MRLHGAYAPGAGAAAAVERTGALGALPPLTCHRGGAVFPPAGVNEIIGASPGVFHELGDAALPTMQPSRCAAGARGVTGFRQAGNHCRFPLGECGAADSIVARQAAARSSAAAATAVYGAAQRLSSRVRCSTASLQPWTVQHSVSPAVDGAAQRLLQPWTVQHSGCYSRGRCSTAAATAVDGAAQRLLQPWTVQHSGCYSRGRLCTAAATAVDGAAQRLLQPWTVQHSGGSSERLYLQAGLGPAREVRILAMRMCRIPVSTYGWPHDPTA
jgi:hypothetical protein